MKVALVKVRGKMEEWYGIQDRGMLGSGVEEIKKVTLLKRTVRCTDEGIEYEADGEHRRKLMQAEGVEEESNSVGGPSVKMDDELEKMDLRGLEKEEHEKLWSMGATINYQGQDRSGRREDERRSKGGEVSGGSKAVDMEV